MRPNVVITLLLIGAIGIAVLFFLKPTPPRPQPVANPISQTAILASNAVPAVIEISPVTNKVVAVTLAAAQQAGRLNQVTGPNADLLQKQVDRLQDLQANDDDASLKEILASLTDTNKIIRHVAIEATIQFGGHTAVPVLRDLATRTSDPGEKKELTDAADFLELPTLTEIRAQNPNVKIISTQPAP
jgi:hypothetical protein